MYMLRGLVALLFALAVIGIGTPSRVLAAETALCGTLTDYTAATAVSDGEMTLDGQTYVIEAGSGADATTSAALTALALTDAHTCLNLTTDDDSGAVTDLAFAATVEVCGDATLTADGDASVAGTSLPAELLSSNSSALLTAAAASDAEVCASLTTAADGSTAGVELGTTTEAQLTATVCATVDSVNADRLVIDDATFDVSDTDLGAELTAGAEVGLRLSAGSDGSLTVVAVDLAGCGNGGAAAGGVTNATGNGAGNGAGDGAQLPDTAMAAPETASPLTLLGLVLLGGSALLAARGLMAARRS